MQHLSPERIAALVDEPASRDEQQHFESCLRCRADFVAVRRIVEAAASERDRPIAPLVPWQQLSTALRAEGVLGGSSVALTPVATEIRSIMSAPSVNIDKNIEHVRRGSPRWMRGAGMAAAASLLVAIGVAGGRVSLSRAGAGAMASSGASSTVASSTPSGGAGAQLSPVVNFRTPDDARATLHSAEEVYSGALMWLASHDSSLTPRQSGSDAAAMNYRQRLEVLDAAMATARRALYEAPDDPVMNRYYLATLGAREVTLRRLTSVLPASQQVLEY
jgi:hypothetical protein